MGNMTWDILIGCTIIVVARVADVSLGTMRTVAVVSGHRGLAWLFGLLEVGIWVFVVSAVIAQIQREPAYGVAFALGAATGNYVGVVLQRWLPFGDQVVRVFTRRGGALFDDLQSHDYRVTKFQGVGRDGEVSMLFIQLRRVRTRALVSVVRTVDPECFYTIDDIRVANAVIARPSLSAGSSAG